MNGIAYVRSCLLAHFLGFGQGPYLFVVVKPGHNLFVILESEFPFVRVLSLGGNTRER